MKQFQFEEAWRLQKKKNLNSSDMLEQGQGLKNVGQVRMMIGTLDSIKDGNGCNRKEGIAMGKGLEI